MKLNENVKIIGKNVILIPYEAKHVKKYHEWMKNPELQQLTASDPLTLQEEYEMQISWRIDDDKCTFLVLDKKKYEISNNEIESLIGDTNLFLQQEDDDVLIAEAEIMIADQGSLGKRYGWESMLLMLKYGLEEIKVNKFVAKIGQDNLKSINMFQKMKFDEVGRSEVFKEITFERQISEDWIQWLEKEIDYEKVNYT